MSEAARAAARGWPDVRRIRGCPAEPCGRRAKFPWNSASTLFAERRPLAGETQQNHKTTLRASALVPAIGGSPWKGHLQGSKTGGKLTKLTKPTAQGKAVPDAPGHGEACRPASGFVALVGLRTPAARCARGGGGRDKVDLPEDRMAIQLRENGPSLITNHDKTVVSMSFSLHRFPPMYS
ncbi:MAG TPA: hypothetical protein PLI09_09745 [Candidatus Hydrogenedentes bacterium]|nr:hypothetical protein [Candidatus Hydrogenedentota bacterium]